MQKGANAFPPKQVVSAVAESSDDDSSDEQVSVVQHCTFLTITATFCSRQTSHTCSHYDDYM